GLGLDGRGENVVFDVVEVVFDGVGCDVLMACTCICQAWAFNVH
ncbi:hypothetical protein A2U01_0110932, partial [Trifolium medium]|nr:hypothetical protein [Trifolium medium]